MKYAYDRKVPFVALIGSDEIEKGVITYKDMESGEQQTVDFDQLLSAFK